MPETTTPLPDLFERRYMTARYTAVVLLAAVLYWSTVIDNSVSVRLVVSGYLVFVVATVALAVSQQMLKARTAQMLLWVAAFDLLSVGLLGLAYHSYEDPSYPVLIALPVLYSMVIRQRQVWIVGLASAFAFIVIHSVAGDLMQPVAIIVTILKALMIVAISWVLADSVARFATREHEIRMQREAEERLNDQLQRRLAELQAVSQITELIHSSLDFDRVGPLVLEILTKVINVASCCVFVIDKMRAETLFSASVGMAGGSIPVQVVGGIIDDINYRDSHFSCTSIVDHKQMMVVFCAESDQIDAMSDEDKLVLQAVSSELLVAVENSQLYKLTKRLAITDQLTGLNNYRFLQQRLDEEIERAKRYHKDLSFLMIDADDFKRFNDTNGHIAGDEALAETGEVLRSVVREVDVVCRYGGEEFSVVLPETDAAGAFVVAEKLREAMATHRFLDGDGERVESLTISIGVATYPIHAKDKESLLRCADDALYHAKGGGKNRVRSPQLIRPVNPTLDAVTPSIIDEL
ncbi:MAG: GGDEF domain-containing protein [Coriobacteriia bacterium]|nr:GGDEF domain-containing protein [Coriobacteriia bacterium]